MDYTPPLYHPRVTPLAATAGMIAAFGFSVLAVDCFISPIFSRIRSFKPEVEADWWAATFNLGALIVAALSLLAAVAGGLVSCA